MPCVYILECSDGSFYTGATVDIDQRLKKHNRGKAAKYTSGRLPVRLVYTEEFSDYNHALKREKQIQKLSRTQKEKLIGYPKEKTK